MKDLVLVGAGRFAREIKALIDIINEQTPTWRFLGFVEEGAKPGQTIEGDKILGGLECLMAMDPKPYVTVPIGDPKTRKRLAQTCMEAGFPSATLIHPNVEIIGDLCTIGEGSILCNGVSLAINTHVGKFCILNMQCGLGHDVVLNDYVSMMPHCIVGGDTIIGEGCYFGMRCTLIDKIKIADGCKFGAGSVVIRNTRKQGSYFGVPAKMIEAYDAQE